MYRKPTIEPEPWTVENTALIVVDMQNCFVRQDGLIPVAQARKQIPKIKKAIEEYKAAGALIIYTAVIWDNPKDIPLGLRTHLPIKMAKWDKYNGLKRGVKGAEIIDELKGLEDEIIEKKTFDAFYKTNLDQILKENRIKSVVLAGTTANNCVYATALGAFARNYEVVALEKCISGFDEQSREAFLTNIHKFIGYKK
jgi:nicotinamidase-related amidase